MALDFKQKNMRYFILVYVPYIITYILICSDIIIKLKETRGDQLKNKT